jgi:hypothetical protein
MDISRIDSFSEFCSELRKVGFSIGGKNDEGIFSLANHYTDRIIDHTGDSDSDPWEWRIRTVVEYDDIAFGKLFFDKSGWITQKWYPYFIAARRDSKSLEDMYFDGLIPNLMKRIYDLIVDNSGIALNEIKTMIGIDKSQKSEFDKAVIKLQMLMFVTINGQKHKVSKEGKAFGWPVTTFCRSEDFFGPDIMIQASKLNQQEAALKITERILLLNENASSKKIEKFIGM